MSILVPFKQAQLELRLRVRIFLSRVYSGTYNGGIFTLPTFTATLELEYNDGDVAFFGTLAKSSTGIMGMLTPSSTSVNYTFSSIAPGSSPTNFTRVVKYLARGKNLKIGKDGKAAIRFQTDEK